jgi:putative aldouronate transport system substrate-binding protein
MDKMIKTDNGTYYAFPFIRGDRSLLKSSGFMVRKDWLDDLNMKPPVTVDDWHAMLTAFKTKKGASVPLALATYFLTGTDFSLMDTYGIARGFFLDDSGKVRYGLIEPGYRSFLTVMNQWYKEGLLDPDFASTGDAQMAAKITSGAAGATMATAGGGMGSYIPSGRATDPHYSLIGVPSPVLRAGEKPSITAFNWYYPGINSAAISTKCGDIAAAVKLLDFGYSQEGSRLYNFGIEGESFTMVNGKPAYTDLIMKNPNGWEFNNIQAAYCQAGSGGPFVQDPGVLVFVYPEQAEAVNVWAPTDVMFTRKIPPVSPTPDESAEFARIMGEINTYTQEMMVKFILGTENLAGFDAYVNSVRRMGIDRAIEIQNTAVGRYKAR